MFILPQFYFRALLRQRVLFAGFFLFLFVGQAFPDSANTFNKLILEKKSMESRFGVHTVECFPFLENIGFTEDQVPLIKNCLAGVRLLASALSLAPDAEIRTAGIGTRFLRTAGFHTVLIPWNASVEEVVDFLRKRVPKVEQNRFLDLISSLKGDIQKKFRKLSFYCSKRISNNQCLSAYKKLAAIERSSNSKPTRWREVVIDDRQGLGGDSHVLLLNFDASSDAMVGLLQKDPYEIWSSRRKMYEDIQERHEGVFEKRLKVTNYYCASGLTEDQCAQGMANLSRAAANQSLRMKAWGEVVIDQYNTLIKGDHDVSIRFDLPPDEIVRYFAPKPNRAEVTESTVLAEKLEKRTLNNSSGLRAVCDLGGLHAGFCARAFENFIQFLTHRRDYRAIKPWSEVMFVDGNRLDRVNFALNSPSRHSYIYIDARSDSEELASHLMKFSGGTGSGKRRSGSGSSNG